MAPFYLVSKVSDELRSNFNASEEGLQAESSIIRGSRLSLNHCKTNEERQLQQLLIIVVIMRRGISAQLEVGVQANVSSTRSIE